MKTMPFSTYQKILIALIAFVQFSVVLDFMVMSPLGDMLMKSLSITPTQFGFAVSAYAFSAGISGFLAAGFADRFDRKKMLLFFYSGFIFGTLLCGLANSYAMLVTARIVTGLFGGVMSSISLAIISDIFVIEQRGRVMGFTQMGFGASQVLGIPVSLYLANLSGWQSPFLMIVAMSMVIALLIWVNMRPITAHLAVQHSQSAYAHLRYTLTHPHYRLGFAATALLSVGGFMIMPFSSAFAINNLHVTPQQLPFLFMVSGISGIIFMPLVGRLSDKMDKFKLFAIASLFTMVAILIYAHLVPMPLWVIILVNILIMLGIMGRMVPAMALTTAVPEMKDCGAFMSITSSLQQIAGGVASSIAGMIVVQKNSFSPLEHYDILGWIIAVVSLLCIFLVYRVNQHVQRKLDKKAAAMGEISERLVNA
ncbi:MFS transporter [Parachlamydia sp. AcF125]|uniref:MFS transporter n=1 Tax=Parachlamydia sp. AcF125 TaxID=2795736 RepID=UPI001BCA52FD|nr:MFS transporter [Parachlamydia sp. AcF125]MBS4168599.1 Purine efflux pump PbuE [Parachlamydia sp. AcF125]